MPPLLGSQEEPATAIQRVRANLVDLMQETLRERREVLSDFAFFSTMQEEIAARIVSLEAMLSERA